MWRRAFPVVFVDIGSNFEAIEINGRSRVKWTPAVLFSEVVGHMVKIKIYDQSMQPALESCFKACVMALGWEYQPDGRHMDMVSIVDSYMRHGCFWCLYKDADLIGMVAARCIDSENNVAELKRLYVLPEHQSNGYGGMLFECALDYVKEQGYRIVRVDTRHDRNASLHLIDNHRFRRVERYNDNEFAELYFELDLE